MTLTIGSLCTGTGALDMAVQSVLDADLAWVADPDAGATRILAHHHPDVPNLGDITAVDWSTVPAVDVLTAGFPCQDISNAGKRAGIGGARSGIWTHVVEAVGVLRPRLALFENVGALVVRGLDTVLADLAAVGFDAEWSGVRASDAGAPHQRERIFILAWPAASDPSHFGHDRTGVARARRHGPADRGCVAADPTGLGHGDPRPAGFGGLQAPAVSGGSAFGLWSDYEPAIRRWEQVTGRPAPLPTEPGRSGERLSPRFVEWLMGLPAGHVTDPAIGLKKTQQLRALGNGVVPQQGAMALRLLLERATADVAA